MTQLTAVMEFEPLLAPGLHSYSLPDLRQLCVDSFPNSRTRLPIMTGLETVIYRLQSKGIPANIWIDGSFLTKKENPNDSDIVVEVSVSFMRNASEEQISAIKWIASDLKSEFRCDSYILPIYPEGDLDKPGGDKRVHYWRKQFGESREGKPKGIAVINISGTV